ncbi:multicopper oxidase family protein [Aquibacillus rhizosphaerae]|uniref:Multicopper oxidase n=1 Tax=Aquibacillus rhizosphaerae TaxID=3051431 RepID=A0ABT7LAX5_9BACI|nr:multicopper oxidase [Aquibacillus sp. LR5S19]MDL4843002.1 multicopper oxidase [Aquibacillus sp. LR5S19]
MSPKLEKFVDRLPIMEPFTPQKENEHGAYYEVSMEQFRQKLHRDLRPTLLWGYNRQFPGPLFDVKQGEAVRVKWINNLPKSHLLPVDKSIVDAKLPEVRTVTHLHGGETPPESDGYPEAWFTNGYNEVGPFFKRKVYEYHNQQRATMLWYHDHTMGVTRLNNYAGLSGAYIIRDQHEKSLNLPTDQYEIPLIIQDRSFNQDGSLSYPKQPDDASDNLPNPSVVPAFLGDTLLVNGKVWPYLEVEPRKYRFRILNASNTRGYQLSIDSGQSFYQIGSDGGLLSKTVKMNTIQMEPSERIDVIIDFSKQEGKNIILKNELGPNAESNDRTDEVMQFKVIKPLSNRKNNAIPKHLSNIPSLKNNRISAMRILKLGGSTDEFGRPLLLLNDKKWNERVEEKPRLGTTEIWSFLNTTGFTHPMHIHLIQFQILDRQTFDLDRYNSDGKIVYTNSPTAPKSNERGWKDTVAAPSAQITRVIAKFAPYTGNYVWHCHILEHEDHDMMRPFTVIDDNDKRK